MTFQSKKQTDNELYWIHIKKLTLKSLFIDKAKFQPSPIFSASNKTSEHNLTKAITSSKCKCSSIILTHLKDNNSINIVILSWRNWITNHLIKVLKWINVLLYSCYILVFILYFRSNIGIYCSIHISRPFYNLNNQYVGLFLQW